MFCHMCVWQLHVLIQHKEATIVCKENKPFTINYNAILIATKINTKTQVIVNNILAKSSLIYTSCV